MNLEETFDFLGLTGSYEEKYRQYAKLLDSGQKNIPIADELLGEEISKNGLCVWHKLKAFKNRYKHGVKFETLSRAFEVPPPQGCELLASVPNSTGREDEEVYLRVTPNQYIAIVVRVEGSLIRIITARKTKAMYTKNSAVLDYSPDSTELFRSFIKAHDGNGNFTNSPGEDVVFWAGIYSSYVDRKISAEDAMFLLTLGLDLSEKHASDFIEDWQVEMGTKYLRQYASFPF